MLTEHICRMMSFCPACGADKQPEAVVCFGSCYRESCGGVPGFKESQLKTENWLRMYRMARAAAGKAVPDIEVLVRNHGVVEPPKGWSHV